MSESRVSQLLKQGTSKLLEATRRTVEDVLFLTQEDFERADPSRKRLVIIGCTGSGKSTLLNVLAGWRFVQSKDTDWEFKWQKKTKEGDDDEAIDPIFEAGAGNDSVTKLTSFANIHFRGDSDRPLTVIDTPGHDDPAGNDIDSQDARDKLSELAADLHNKLKALGHVHAILVLHNDSLSNRLNPATYQILKLVDEKFAHAGETVWQHVIVGYSKCNAHETSWRAGLEKKRADLSKTIRDKIPNCKVDVPVVALGGGEIEPAPPSKDEADGLEQLWEFVAKAPAVSTKRLEPFEGLDVKYQKMINERDQATAEAKAAIIYISIIAKLVGMFVVLFWRHMMLPAWLSVLLLNIPGLYDEILLFGGLVYVLGPQNVLYSARHFTRQWVLPVATQHLGNERLEWLTRWSAPAKPKAD